MICVTTRFRLRHFWMLLPMYLTYRRMRRDLKQAPGLIRYAFLLQNPVACCTLSLWESEATLIAFSNVPSYVHAVRRAKRWCRDIWSAYWRNKERTQSMDAIIKWISERLAERSSRRGFFSTMEKALLSAAVIVTGQGFSARSSHAFSS